MKNAKVLVNNLQSKLGDDFTVTQNGQGELRVFDHIMECYLSSDEINLLLQEVDGHFMVRDVETGFTCTYFTFSKVGQGKGQRAKWFYSTYENYPEGVYYMTAKTVQAQLRYLENMNYYLGLNKIFEIFEVFPDSLIFSKNHRWEELIVTKYNKPTSKFLIQDESTGNYVSSDSVFITKDEILYSTHTGRANGLEYSHSFEMAAQIANSVKDTLDKYGIYKNFKIIEVIKEKLPKGEMVIEHFSKMIVGVIS